jgi:hypothetical protein
LKRVRAGCSSPTPRSQKAERSNPSGDRLEKAPGGLQLTYSSSPSAEAHAGLLNPKLILGKKPTEKYSVVDEAVVIDSTM